MQGFIYTDYKKTFPAAISQLTKHIQEGKLKFKEDILQGLDSAPNGLQRLLLGNNDGKVIIQCEAR